MDQSTFHAGEQAIQLRAGVRDELAAWGRKVVRPYLPEQHREFYRHLPFLVAAARDAEGRPWATLLAGPPGFASSPDPRRLVIAASPGPGDALEGRLGAGGEVGVLGIELSTRRRNRVNGRVAAAGPSGLELAVDQTFGNCPQYIRPRHWRWAPAPAGPPPGERTRALTPAMIARIGAADTFFIASGHRGEGEASSYGMDASHRGGPPGFVRVEGERRLVFPDYAGNNHFNTLGNLVLDGRAGLLFVDFEGGGLLQLTGRVTIDWGSPALALHPGAQRLLVFELDEAVDRPAALPLRFDAEGAATRALRVASRRRESDDVVSFVLASRDGSPLPPHRPGQHLPIELAVPGERQPVRRTYSISNAPGEGTYRISVKREPAGLASRFLHDALAEGALASAGAPSGDFVLEPGDHPIALVSAGVGVTPMMAMLAELVRQGDPRRVVFVHAVRDGAHHPFAGESRALVAAARHASRHVFYSRPRPEDRPGEAFDAAGRLDADRLAALLPEGNVDIYLCGPVPFMAELHEGLARRGVPPERIRYESFGPRPAG
ncbi:MAG TPA: pyridoxamine 5'-phosphate oxidase family protein [Polyangiaceae bacterium]|nr:pyridoxamine 5'-phosphate oxidase family protein [Polyangiaceae bacterium]